MRTFGLLKYKPRSAESIEARDDAGITTHFGEREFGANLRSVYLGHGVYVHILTLDCKPGPGYSSGISKVAI